MAGLLGGLKKAAKVAKSGGTYSAPSRKNLRAVRQRGKMIVDMLKSGRASEVTDEMLDMGNAVQNTRLNMYLADNYDIPLDAKSREMYGSFLDKTLKMRHGTDNRTGYDAPDITEFKAGDRGKTGSGIYGDTELERSNLANRYAGDWRDRNYNDMTPEQIEEYYKDYARRMSDDTEPYGPRAGGLMYDLLVPDGPYASMNQLNEARDIATQNIADRRQRFESRNPAGNALLQEQGYKGVHNALTSSDPDLDELMVYNPADIRSRFARLDPRLAHLKNISAGIGVGLLAPEITEYLARVEREQRDGL